MMRIKILLLFVSLFLIPKETFSQGENLFNLENSLKFARFLNQKGNHDMAILEWERINMMQPGQDSFQFPLIQSFRKSGQFEAGIKRFDILFPGSAQFNCSNEVAREMNRMLFLNKDFSRLKNFIKSHQELPTGYTRILEVGLMLREGQTKAARSLFQDYQLKDPQLELLLTKGDNLSFKSKGLALSMSALLPGSGKAYLGNWKDGLVSLIFIAGAGYASYRGFSQQGINSTYGWIFGSISTGFYFGNLFGTAKAVTKYNKGVSDHYRADVEGFLYRRL